MHECLSALRTGYEDLVRGEATYIPRIDLYAPTPRTDDYYRWGSMAGASKSFGIHAIRMKSDIVYWPDGRREEKYCKQPGLYCGLIILFSTETAEPLAIIQDGILQHMRVGACAGLGAEALSRTDSKTLGLLGSGGMARTYFEAIVAVRSITTCKVYSPTQMNRESFAAEMNKKYPNIQVIAVDQPEEAVRNSDIVATATNSLTPTFDPAWVAPGTHLTCVSRRELSPEIIDLADVTLQLGYNTIPPNDNIPDMVWWPLGGFATYVSGNAEERARIPRGRAVAGKQFPTLLDFARGSHPGRTSPDQITFFVTTGTQGLQFASVGGRVLQLVTEHGLGVPLPQEWFLQDIRD